jgi:hypothetical protein
MTSTTTTRRRPTRARGARARGGGVGAAGLRGPRRGPALPRAATAGRSGGGRRDKSDCRFRKKLLSMIGTLI